jgi:hypothetical protein
VAVAGSTNTEFANESNAQWSFELLAATTDVSNPQTNALSQISGPS